MTNAAKKKKRAAPAKVRGMTKELVERWRIIRYIRREAKRLKAVWPVPDKIIQDTMVAIANEIERGLHDVRR